MEELLNKLIEKGWKPFGIKSDNICLYCLKDNKIVISYYEFDTEWECDHEDKRCSYRELVSKESWLWQFVCENKLVNTKDKKVRYRYEDLERTQNYYSWYWYEYRLIECALKDEKDLEKFLLDNIKIWK